MNLNSRYLGALLIAPFIIFIFLGGVFLKYFIVALSVLGMYEFYKVVKVKKFNPLSLVGYLLLIMYYAFNNNFEALMYILIFTSLISLCIPVINVKYNFIDVALTIMGFIYVGVFFSFIYLVSCKLGGQFLVWLIFIASWLCDTTAYYTGKYLGKRKLCPLVSPNKTIAGSIGGLLGSTLSLGLYGYIITAYIPDIKLYHYFIIGILCGILCQFGDLVASSIKRYVGVKDYSNLIPGHGGILDRFDSILFAGTIIYFYLTFILGY
ncbi:phosphatidate cytidylyltransferase [Clostridium polyendosporum]|uniref:Phosphatidate cytidylyltransferase n=1 Tax=Clostridium polyendosporum TaxID=69208 RepID=A0A919VFS8_9CLOT|nr:phosphatidate cytidylyltransferase [Clostridium polyendosporum]GIM27811.1 phosphatidate cytidylyltransferase [Clostridium polyendosporum]